MSVLYSECWPQFFTATILEWKPLLHSDKYKDEIIKSFRYLVKQKRIKLYAFVIMNNHIHLIWQPMFGHSVSSIQASFMKYTSRQLKSSLLKNDQGALTLYKVDKYDRAYQFWKRGSLSIELRTASVFEQKLTYMHNNPVVAGLCEYPEEYHYSSARFYHEGIDIFNILTHYTGN